MDEDSLLTKFKDMKFDDGLGNLESYEFLSYSLLEENRKLIYSQAGCFDINSTIYGVKYMKLDGKTIEHILQQNGDQLQPIYCECGISYEPLSPSCL